MKYRLAYLTVENNEKILKEVKDIDVQEYELLEECNKILSSFNMFCDYFSMLENNMNEIINYLNEVKVPSYKIINPIMKHKLFIEINRLMINFSGMFRNFLEYHERFIKEIYSDEENGDTAKELTDFKKSCSERYDNFFEYRFLYNLRHYIIHYKIPITILKQEANHNRHFFINKDELKKWKGWKPTIKTDIQNLEENIDIENFMINIKKMLTEFKKDISFISKFEVLGAIKILNKYTKNNATPYITISNTKNNKEILSLFDELIVSRVNIEKLGHVSISIFDKDKGFVLYDPYDLQFTKEEKEKFGF